MLMWFVVVGFELGAVCYRNEPSKRPRERQQKIETNQKVQVGGS
jgi:hypothetical protein